MARTLLQLQLHSKATRATIDATNGMRVDFGIPGAHKVIETRKNSSDGLFLKINNTSKKDLQVTVLHGYKPWAGTVGANHSYNPDDLVIPVPAQSETDIWPVIHAAGGLGRFARDNDLSFDVDFDSGLNGLPIVLSYV